MPKFFPPPGEVFWFDPAEVPSQDQHNPLVETYRLEQNQTNKADSGKIKPRLLIEDMAEAIEHVSAVLTYGAEKYEERGWKTVHPDRYIDAMYRHRLAFTQGEDYDKESGLHHLAHFACNAMFLLQMELVAKGKPEPKWNSPPQDHKVNKS